MKHKQECDVVYKKEPKDHVTNKSLSPKIRVETKMLNQKRGEIQARFQFPISASSPSALSQMYRGKKAGKGGETGGNEDDSQDRQNFEKGRKERRDRPRPSFSFLHSQLPL